MPPLDQTLLTLYGAASDVAPTEFPELALGLVQTLIGFDSAGRSTLDMQSGATVVSSADVYRERPSLMHDWDSVKCVDPVLAHALEKPHRAVAFHSRSIEQATPSAAMRHYLALSDHHQNGIAILAPGAVAGTWDALGFYRRNADRQFNGAEMRLVDILAPHIHQAMKINRNLFRPVTSVAAPTSAVARVNGQLQHAAPEFIALLQAEWPTWQGSLLPAPLLVALHAGVPLRYSGAQIAVSASLSGEVIVLAARRKSPLASLSERERQAVMLFGAGKSTKEIARHLDVMHNSVRNFVQRAYKKLGISDKAALAVLLSTWSTAES